MPAGSAGTAYVALFTPVTRSPVKTGVALGFLAGSSRKITTLCWIPTSWLVKSSSIGLSAATESVVGWKPVTAAPFGAISATTCGPPPPPVFSPVPIVTIAMPPASIATPATTPIMEKSVPLDSRSRDATIVATPRIVAATTRAITVAAAGDTESRTREKPKSTSPMPRKMPRGMTMGSSNPCRVSGCVSGAGAGFSSVS